MGNYILVVVTAGCVAIQAMLGFFVTTRTPSVGQKRIYEAAFVLVGIISMACVIFSNIQSSQSTSRAQQSLEKIDSELNNTAHQFARVAELLKIDPSQGAENLANRIIDKFSTLQAEIEQQTARISEVEKKDKFHFYQGNQAVAFVSGSFRYTPINRTLVFDQLYDAANIDFSREIYFRGLSLACEKKIVESSIEFFSGNGTRTNGMTDLHCLIPDTEQGNPLDLLGPWSAPQAPPPQPEKK